MKTYIQKLHYEKELKGFDKILFFLLKIFSIPYFIVLSFKNYLYKKKVYKIYDSGCYVISVGNLTTGGTGKTPITAEIAKYLVTQKCNVCIVSRGYKGKLNNKIPHVISDGNTIYYDADMAGDEPYWLAKNCNGVKVITCSSRKKAILYANKEYGCDKFILDDGFQHQKVKRDMNILVIDGEKKFGNELILPAGPLREPITEIYRANRIVIVNKRNTERGLRGYKRVLERVLNMPVFLCNMKLDKPYNIITNEGVDNAKFLAFCAIGQPEQFFNLLPQEIKNTKIFEDHHSYSQKDIDDLQNYAKECGATALITTEKDAVKLKNLRNIDNIYAAALIPNIDISEVLK